MRILKKKRLKNDIKSQTSSSAPFYTSLCFFDGRQPPEREGDYLVFRDNCLVPEKMFYNGVGFVDLNTNLYCKVFCWAPLPHRPPLNYF